MAHCAPGVRLPRQALKTDIVPIMESQYTIEQKVSSCILEHETDVIELNGHEYRVAAPTLGTIIMVSGLVSELPPMDGGTQEPLLEVLRHGKDCSVLARIAATMILGAKRIKECRKIATTTQRTWWRPWHRTAIERYEIDALTEAILDGVSPRTLTGVVNRLLIEAQIGDFFAITTSLCEANRLKSTVEVETPSGEVSTTYPESLKQHQNTSCMKSAT